MEKTLWVKRGTAEMQVLFLYYFCVYIFYEQKEKAIWFVGACGRSPQAIFFVVSRCQLHSLRAFLISVHFINLKIFQHFKHGSSKGRRQLHLVLNSVCGTDISTIHDSVFIHVCIKMHVLFPPTFLSTAGSEAGDIDIDAFFLVLGK